MNEQEMSKPLVDSTHMLCVHIVRIRDWYKYWELLCVIHCMCAADCMLCTENSDGGLQS